MYLHTDHLGAVVKATDEVQAVVWDVDRKPFGERESLVGQVEVPLGFPGQYFDEETNNYYNYFRVYDPGTGRYLQSDPIGLGGGINTFAYVGGNPLLYIDPEGLQFLGAPPPPGVPGGPWTWQPDPHNSRGGRFQDPAGNRANWDPSGHWDVEDKDGNRQRYDRWGNKTDRHRNPGRKGSDKPIKNWPKPRFNPLYWIPDICIFMPELCDPNLRPDTPGCS